jgi:hypothetical protein
LRQSLGVDFIRDTVVGLVASWGQTANSLNFIDAVLADPSLSGQGLYVGSSLWFSAGEVRVASFNAASGALFSTSRSITPLTQSGNEYERHDTLPGSEKNRAINDALRRIRVRREVGIDAIDGGHLYALDTAASPHAITHILDVYYFANPSGTLGRDLRGIVDWEIVPTATGTDLRIEPALTASQQLCILADIALTLGSGDAATINIPSDEWLLSGAAAKSYDLLIRRAPGQSRGQYEKSRAEFARSFSRLSAIYAPPQATGMQGLLEEVHDPF